MSTQPHQKVCGQELIMSPQDRSVEQPGRGGGRREKKDGGEIFTSAINMERSPVNTNGVNSDHISADAAKTRRQGEGRQQSEKSLRALGQTILNSRQAKLSNREEKTG